MNYSNIDSRIRTKVVLRPKARTNQTKLTTGQTLPEIPESSREESQKRKPYHLSQAIEK